MAASASSPKKPPPNPNRLTSTRTARPNRYAATTRSSEADGNFEKKDEMIDLTDEPDHDELCKREQEYFLKAIHEDLDLTDHMNDAVNSLAIVLAADKAFREGRTVDF